MAAVTTHIYTDETLEELCEVSHNAYEQYAVEAGWVTQEASRKPWANVPEANKATVRFSLEAVLSKLGYAYQPTLFPSDSAAIVHHPV